MRASSSTTRMRSGRLLAGAFITGSQNCNSGILGGVSAEFAADRASNDPLLHNLPVPHRRGPVYKWCMKPHPLALAAWAVAAAAAQAQTPVATLAPPQNVVSISATATLEVPKDQLTLVFSTTREGLDAAVVQSQLRQALDTALTEARRAARPGQVEVQTGGFSVVPRWSPKGGTNGWTGTAELIVEGRDLAAVSQLAGRIQTMSVARTGYGLSREAREKLDADVTAQAIARFRTKAEQVAKAFGFGGWSLREVQVVGTDQVAPQPMMRVQATRAMAAGADESLPVEAGKTTVSASVSGTVQLSPR